MLVETDPLILSNTADDLPYPDVMLLIFQNDFISGQTPFEEEQLEAAISGVIFQTIEKEQTVCDAAFQVSLGKQASFDLTVSRLIAAIKNSVD